MGPRERDEGLSFSRGLLRHISPAKVCVFTGPLSEFVLAHKLMQTHRGSIGRVRAGCSPPASTMRASHFLRYSLACFAFLTAFLSAKPKWEPVSPEDLSATESRDYPGMPAEYLFHRLTMDGDSHGAWCGHYLRIKVYNSQGAQKEGHLAVTTEKKDKVWGLGARLIKRDGTVTEFSEDQFSETDLLKSKDAKLRRQAIAIPDLEPGDIVEYAWFQEVASGDFNYQWWYAQSPLPTREFRFILAGIANDTQVLMFNVGKSERLQTPRGQELVARNLPPFIEEPLMPPTRDVRGWVAVANTSKWLTRWGQEEAWSVISSEWGEDFRLRTKPDSAAKELAQRLVAEATTEEEKLQRLYDYCRTKILNFNYFDNAELQAARKRLEKSSEPQSVKETFKRLSGYPYHVNEAFATLCRALGYDVRIQWNSSRLDTTNIRHVQGFYFLEYSLVAVKVGEGWRYYSPADYFVPSGLLAWQYQYAPGLFCDEKEFKFLNASISDAHKSEIARTAKLTLEEEGHLEGTVEEVYTGLCATALKKEWFTLTREERESAIRARIAARAPHAEISDVAWENVNGIALPLKYSYKVRIPDYAEVLGDRLVLAPAVFHRLQPPPLTAPTRQFYICLEHPYKETDRVDIKLPASLTLDAGAAPPAVGSAEEPIRATYRLGLRRKAHTLSLTREAVYGDFGGIAYPPEAYAMLKRRFEDIAQADQHPLILKPQEVAAPAP